MQANCPIEKQQSLAINQAGQINTHSMQLGPSGDSEAPVLVPPFESTAEHRLNEAWTLNVYYYDVTLHVQTNSNQTFTLHQIDSMTPECLRMPQKKSATLLSQHETTKKPKGVFSVLLVPNLTQPRRIDRARLACDLQANELLHPTWTARVCASPTH